MQLHTIAFYAGLAGAALWIAFTIYETCVALYRVYTTRQLLKAEQLFLDRWYTKMAEDKESMFVVRCHSVDPGFVHACTSESAAYDFIMEHDLNEDHYIEELDLDVDLYHSINR